MQRIFLQILVQIAATENNEVLVKSLLRKKYKWKIIKDFYPLLSGSYARYSTKIFQ